MVTVTVTVTVVVTVKVVVMVVVVVTDGDSGLLTACLLHTYRERRLPRRGSFSLLPPSFCLFYTMPLKLSRMVWWSHLPQEYFSHIPFSSPSFSILSLSADHSHPSAWWLGGMVHLREKEKREKLYSLSATFYFTYIFKCKADMV